MKNIAIIGLGDISSLHLNAINNIKDAKLVCCCDIDISTKTKVDESVRFYTDYKKMNENEKIDIVHICLPHYLHYEVSKYFLENNVHVFCEKPAGLNFEEVKKFYEITKKSSYKAGICFQNRYNKTNVQLKEIISSNKYGKIIGIKAIVPWYRDELYYKSKPWRAKLKYAGGGCMINQSIHTLDLMTYFCGDVDKLKAVVSRINGYDFVEGEDSVFAKIYFKNGARGLFIATIANYKNESVEISIEFEKGSFIIKDQKLYEIINGEYTFICEDLKVEGKKFYYGKSHSIIIEDFYNAIDSNIDFIGVKDALISSLLIDKIKESSDLNKEVFVEEIKL